MPQIWITTPGQTFHYGDDIIFLNFGKITLGTRKYTGFHHASRRLACVWYLYNFLYFVGSKLMTSQISWIQRIIIHQSSWFLVPARNNSTDSPPARLFTTIPSKVGGIPCCLYHPLGRLLCSSSPFFICSHHIFLIQARNWDVWNLRKAIWLVPRAVCPTIRVWAKFNVHIELLPQCASVHMMGWNMYLCNQNNAAWWPWKRNMSPSPSRQCDEPVWHGPL